MRSRGPDVLILVLAAGSSLSVSALRSQSSWTGSWRSSLPILSSYTFERFIQDFGRKYEVGTSEYVIRSELFDQRRKEMIEFNAKPNMTWKMGISKFMDWQDSEKPLVYGYAGHGSRTGEHAIPAMAVSLQRSPPLPAVFELQMARNRSTRLLRAIRDQGNCGSCWAEAATSTLEGHLEANAELMRELAELRRSDASVPEQPELSLQAMVSCTPNVRNCGGRGGCSGATVELAYDMIKGNGGLPLADSWKYESGLTGRAPECRKGIFGQHRIGIQGYAVLPSNKLHPLKAALVDSGGPVAVSIDATNWFNYAEGVYSDVAGGRKGDFTVNHGVVLLGYKSPEKGMQGWWTIKNSWGRNWGEEGLIRLELKEEEEAHCGWDHDTHVGIACDGDPNDAWVCGTCGILYDGVYPTGLYLRKGGKGRHQRSWQ